MKTYGYDRKTKVPANDNTKPKLCPKCEAWFSALPRARVCDGCQPRWVMARRSQTLSEPYSHVSSSTSSQSRTDRKLGNRPGRSICFELARELAVTVDGGMATGPRGRPPKTQPLTRAMARRTTERNVNDGKQGRCDLERYSMEGC